MLYLQTYIRGAIILKFKYSVLAIVILFISAANVYPSVRRICKVSYETEIGFSKEYVVEITFTTGNELNEATGSYIFSNFDNYALIWFDQGEVAILEIDSIVFGIGEEFDSEDFKKLFYLMGETKATQVNSDSPRTWRIKAKELFDWIDPRVEAP